MSGLQALPQWSQQALQQHAGDAREIKSLEQLESGTTGDVIWDAMQHQLKTYGAALAVDYPTGLWLTSIRVRSLCGTPTAKTRMQDI